MNDGPAQRGSWVREFDWSRPALPCGAVGREGGGPGEFGALNRIWPLRSDSIVMYDASLNRLTVLSINGTFARSFSLRVSSGQVASPVGLLGGSYLVAEIRALGDAPDIREGIHRDTRAYVRFSMSGALVDTIGWFPGGDYATESRSAQFIIRPVPYGRQPSTAIGPSGFFFGIGDAYVVDVYDADGALEKSMRWTTPNDPVAKTALDGLAARLGGSSFGQTILAGPMQETKPAYGEFVLDTEGNLWVAEYRERRAEIESWTVFDSDGRLLGSVRIPPGGRVTQIGPDYLVGVWRDADDVEHVQVHELTKP